MAPVPEPAAAAPPAPAAPIPAPDDTPRLLRVTLVAPTEPPDASAPAPSIAPAQAEEAGEAAQPWPDDDPPARAEPASRRWALLLAGALVVMALIGGLALWLRPPPWAVYQTGPGEVRSVTIGTGTSVVIDSSSELSAPDHRAAREATLGSGRALFSVPAGGAGEQPFVAHAGAATITAARGTFALELDPSAADVTVLVVDRAVDVALGSRHWRVAPQQRLRLSGDGAMSAPLTLARRDLARALAWRGGGIELDGESLGDAVTEVNRHSRVIVRIGDPALARTRLYGIYRLDDADGFARSVAAQLGTSAISDGAAITIGSQRQ